MAKRIPWPFWVRVDKWGDASVHERLPNGRTRRIVSRTSMERAEAWLKSWGRDYGIVYEDTSAWVWTERAQAAVDARALA